MNIGDKIPDSLITDDSIDVSVFLPSPAEISFDAKIIRIPTGWIFGFPYSFSNGEYGWYGSTEPSFSWRIALGRVCKYAEDNYGLMGLLIKQIGLRALELNPCVWNEQDYWEDQVNEMTIVFNEGEY